MVTMGEATAFPSWSFSRERPSWAFLAEKTGANTSSSMPIWLGLKTTGQLPVSMGLPPSWATALETAPRAVSATSSLSTLAAVSTL